MTTQQQLTKIINILEDHTIRFDRLEDRMDKLEGRMDGLEQRMDKLEGRMDGLESRMDKLESRMNEFEIQFNSFKEETKLMFIGVGDAYVKLSAKLDDVMNQIKEIPQLRKDVNRLEHESADMKLNIFDLNAQHRKMDQKLDKIIDKVNIIAANHYV